MLLIDPIVVIGVTAAIEVIAHIIHQEAEVVGTTIPLQHRLLQ